MAKTRRATQEEIFTDPESTEDLTLLSIDDGAEIDEPIATEEHTIRTKFIRQVPVSAMNAMNATPAAAATAPPLPGLVAPPPAAIDEETPPHIAQFLREMGDSDQGWQMVVYSLPTFAIDGRTDPARRKLCGVMDFTRDYEIEIQRRYARENLPNDFLVVVKKRGVYVKGGTLPVFSCLPLPPSERIMMPGDLPTPTAPAAAAPSMAYPYPIQEAPAPPIDPLKLVRDQITMMKLMREAFGAPAAEPPAPPPPPDPETAFLQVLAKDRDMMGKLTKRTLNNLLGDSVADRNEWAEVAMEAVKSGQAAQIIGSVVNSLFAGFAGLMPRPEAPPAPAAPPAAPRAAAPPQRPPAGPAPLAPTEPPPTVDESQSPELQVLGLALDHCARHLPPQVAAGRIVAIAQQIRETVPAYAIDNYLDLFAAMDAASALEICRTLMPDRAEITQLPHALEWTAALQDLLKPEETDGTD